MTEKFDKFIKVVRRRRLDVAFVCTRANVLALTGVDCDNAILAICREDAVFYTDFRYIPMVHRVAPDLICRDLKRFKKISGRRIGYESDISVAQYEKLRKKAIRGATFVDVSKDIGLIRAVKNADEVARLRAAETLALAIYDEATAQFHAGMTEKQMARVIQHLMIERGDGEAFDTIVCIGKNAAECHHVPDDTVWNGRECVLIDMGVKLGGVCSDLTRNIVPRASSLYKKVYALVQKAHDAAIAAAKPGMTAAALDRVARDVIKKGSFGKCFGHSLGHGVGYEIHEAPAVSKRDKTVLKPGMTVTIEPGIYLEDNLGVRIEDLILITNRGCELLHD